MHPRTHSLREYAAWALSQGTSPESIRRAVRMAGYSSASANLALRQAGHRTRSVRSDAGKKRSKYHRQHE